MYPRPGDDERVHAWVDSPGVVARHDADPRVEEEEPQREMGVTVIARREVRDGRAALDPVEHAILWIGVAELRSRPQTPWRVAISEAVSLAKRFGATDGHKFVNAVLDKAARALRGAEIALADG